jgi:hypothetical protein
VAKQTCEYCAGPLRVELGVVVCEYCGKPNNPSGLPGKTQLRQVVRDVVSEDLNRNGIPDVMEQRNLPQQQIAAQQVAQVAHARRRAMLFVYVGVGSLLSIAFVVPMLIGQRRASKSSPREVPAKSLTSSKAEAPAKIKDYGETTAVLLVDDATPHLFAVVGKQSAPFAEPQLLRIDAQSLLPQWSVPLEVRASHEVKWIRVVAEQLMVSLDSAAVFYNAKTGALIGRFSYLESGFGANGICVVGNDVILDMSFSKRLRLDSTTAKKSSATGWCKPQDVEHRRNPDGQITRNINVSDGDMQCRQELSAGNERYRICKVDDGSNRSAVVALGNDNGKGKTTTKRWTSFVAQDPRYMGVVGNVVVVVFNDTLQGFDSETGKSLWTRDGQQYNSNIVTRMTTLYFGDKTTLVKVDALTGKTLATLNEPALP